MNASPIHVLFVCTGNAGRSQMAAALFARLAGPRAVVFSAGVDPWDHLHPVAVRLLAARGIDISACRPKHVRTFVSEPLDLVVTIGEPAREKTPEMRGNPRRVHWPIKDPADADLEGPVRQEAAFRIAMADIEARLGPLMQISGVPRAALRARCRSFGGSVSRKGRRSDVFVVDVGK